MGTSMVDTMFVNLVAKTIDGDAGYNESMSCDINKSGYENARRNQIEGELKRCRNKNQGKLLTVSPGHVKSLLQ